MQNVKLLISAVSSWAMALTYDWIKRVTGHEIRILLYAGLITLAIGLYVGLYAKNKETKKEETYRSLLFFYV